LLPDEHIFSSSTPSSNIRKWILHPVKRRLAKYYLVILRQLNHLKVIAITGSAGKTTTKEMIASILKREGRVVASYKNIDPVYNIPDTILKCGINTKYLVLEMGVEYKGEMDFYLWLAKPDISVITNIYPTHTLFFGNEEGVFAEKKKITACLGRDDWAILNLENKYLKSLKNKLSCKIWGFGGLSEHQAENVSISLKGTKFIYFNKDTKYKLNIDLPLAGDHFAMNALASIGVSEILNINKEYIVKGLRDFALPENRMRIVQHKSGALIVDDSYNSNPAAAKKALANFNDISKGYKKIVVFGDMLELGKLDNKLHRELGIYMRKLKIDDLITVGKTSKTTGENFKNDSKSSESKHFDEWENASKYVKKFLKSGNAILIKGSRSINLDKLTQNLLKLQ